MAGNFRIPIILVVIILWGLGGVGHGAFADNVPAPPSLKNKIIALLDAPTDPRIIINFLKTNIHNVTKDADIAVAAMILARQNQDYVLALTIGDKTLANGIKTPRLIYEIGLVFLLTNNCIQSDIIMRKAALSIDYDTNGDQYAWMKAEIEQAKKLCELPPIWIYDQDVAISYENNLSGSLPMQTVKPEKGSVLGEYYRSLRQVLPDLPEEVTVGVKPQAGIATSLRQFLNYQHSEDRAHYSIHLASNIKLTHPRGYEQINAIIGLKRTVIGQHLTFGNELKFYSHISERGPGNGQVDTDGIVLNAEIGLKTRIRPSLIVNMGKARSKITYHSIQDSREIIFRLKHVPTQDGLPWYLQIHKARAQYDIPYQINKTRGLTLGIDHIPVSPTKTLSVDISRSIARPEIALWWLSAPHKTKTDRANLLFHGLRNGRPYTMTASWHRASSQNQVDNVEGFTLSFRIKILYSNSKN